jgi:hypothetical protein
MPQDQLDWGNVWIGSRLLQIPLLLVLLLYQTALFLKSIGDLLRLESTIFMDFEELSNFFLSIVMEWTV